MKTVDEILKEVEQRSIFKFRMFAGLFYIPVENVTEAVQFELYLPEHSKLFRLGRLGKRNFIVTSKFGLVSYVNEYVNIQVDIESVLKDEFKDANDLDENFKILKYQDFNVELEFSLGKVNILYELSPSLFLPKDVETELSGSISMYSSSGDLEINHPLVPYKVQVKNLELGRML